MATAYTEFTKEINRVIDKIDSYNAYDLSTDLRGWLNKSQFLKLLKQHTKSKTNIIRNCANETITLLDKALSAGCTSVHSSDSDLKQKHR